LEDFATWSNDEIGPYELVERPKPSHLMVPPLSVAPLLLAFLFPLVTLLLKATSTLVGTIVPMAMETKLGDQYSYHSLISTSWAHLKSW
jgi:hypothetical protein